jgi:hypothetical protein
MHSPLKTATVLALVFFWSRTLLFAADATQDPLWHKAVTVAAANADWVPGLVITRSEVLHKGEVVGVHQTADETDTMVCRRCRLDIRLGLREK